LYQIFYSAPVEVGLEINELLTKKDILEILEDENFNLRFLEIVKDYYKLKTASEDELSKMHYDRFKPIPSADITMKLIDSQAEKYSKKHLLYKEYLNFSEKSKRSHAEYQEFIQSPRTHEILATYAHRFILEHPEYFPKLRVTYEAPNYKVEELREPKVSQTPNRYEDVHALLNNELDGFLDSLKIEPDFKDFYKKILYYLLTEPPPVHIDKTDFFKSQRHEISSRMSKLLNAFLKQRRDREAAEIAKDAQPFNDKPVSEEVAGPYSSRPFRDKKEADTPPKIELNKIEIKTHDVLQPEERKELVSKHIPPFIHTRVYKALETIQGKLPEKEYAKVYKMIVDTLAKSEANVKLQDIAALSQTTYKDIWKINPHVSSSIRIFFGKGTNGNLMLLSIEDDIKSGDKTENKIISDLAKEWETLRTRYGY
jgi:hypothetical protein